MTGKIKSAFDRFGLCVEVEHRGERCAAKAFLQPITAEKRDEPFSVGVLGAVDERCWRYLGSADAAVTEGDRIVCGAQQYLVRRAAAVMAGERVTHYWAVVSKEVSE